MRGGNVIGATDRLGGYPVDAPQTPENMAASIYQALGLPKDLVWRDELTRLSWSPLHIDGSPLRDYLEAERNEFIAVLGELCLLKAPHGN